MPDSRLVLIEGLPTTGKTRLAQELGLQLEAHQLPHRHWLATAVGNPLARPFEAEAYAGFDSYAESLARQWQNFAIRAATEREVQLFDGALFNRHLADALHAGTPAPAISTLVSRLVETLEPLSPALFYLSRPPNGETADQQAWRSCCDAAFADLSSQRVLLNAGRASAAELLEDVLHELDLPPVQLELAESVAAQLPGAYGATSEGNATPQLQIMRDAQLLNARLPGHQGMSDWRPLLASPQGHFVVAGIDLRLYPQQVAGRLQGLLPESQTPAVIDSMPAFLLRQSDRQDA